MSVLIVGANGSMGRRYQAILRYLGKHFVGIDKGDAIPSISYDGYIIATPTETHAQFVKTFAPFRKPILVEKPLSKNVKEVSDLLTYVSETKTPLKMMMQYDYLTENSGYGASMYDYFRHGSDGLVWDCIQIIASAKGEIYLNEMSPIWKCVINGRELSIADMDFAYVRFVEDWFKDPYQSLQRIEQIHLKTDALEKSGLYG